MSIGVEDYTKLISVVCVIIAATLLGMQHVLSGDAVTALLGGCLGYVFGNGHGILSAKATIDQVKQNYVSGGTDG